MPPLAVISITLPTFSPHGASVVCVAMLVFDSAFSTTALVSVQPFSSLTVRLKTPASSPLILGPVSVPFNMYVYIPVPPVAVRLISPSALPAQFNGVKSTSNASKGGSVIK